MSPVTEVDHLAYVTQRRYRRLVHARLMAQISKKIPPHIHTLCGPDGTCCSVEPVEKTYVRIIRALQMDGASLHLVDADGNRCEHNIE